MSKHFPNFLYSFLHISLLATSWSEEKWCMCSYVCKKSVAYPAPDQLLDALLNSDCVSNSERNAH
jgi:hypothetical protein